MVRLYMTANREQKKLSTIDKKEEFEQRKEISEIYLYRIQNERLREEERKRREQESREIEETRKQQLEAQKKKEEENKRNSPEEIAKKEKQTEMFLNLKEKARKLASGEMKIEEYIQTSKTSIDELIAFAKKQKMGSDIVRALSKLKPQYAVYKQPFKKEEYLAQTTLIIDGEYVKPTEKDVDLCIAYLNATNSLICYKIVSDTVRKFLRGELDITLKTEELQERIEDNKAIIAQNETEIKENLVDVILAQQSKIQSQEAEKTELKSQRRDVDE